MKSNVKLLIVLFSIVIIGLSGFKTAGVTNVYSFPVGTKPLATKPPSYLFSLGGKEKETESLLAGFLKDPMGVSSSPDGKIYVADTGNSLIRVFSSDGGFLATFGKGSLSYPIALSVIDSKIYVADPNLMKVAVYDEEGNEQKPLISKVQLTFTSGKTGELIRPTGIQKGLDGNFYISDIGNHSIVVVNPQGEIIRNIGEEGTEEGDFKFPNGLWITGKGKIFVSDSNNRRIQIFDNKGDFLYKINGSYGTTGAFSLPRGVAVTEQGIILVVDVFSHKIRALDEAGLELWSFGGLGSGTEKFNFPNGIFFDSLSARLYVTDRENNRVQVFGYRD
jgi:DNA-binding beta-propeller fold protein YncE